MIARSLALLAAAATVATLPAASVAKNVSDRPCDIYAAAHTPCTAAHSSTRALFAHYKGPLYQVQRASDQALFDVGTTDDGYANAPAQDAFCASTTCVVKKIYDQTKNHNDLGVSAASPDPQYNTVAKDPVGASDLPVTVGGHPVYGLWFKLEPFSGDNSGAGHPLVGSAGHAYNDLHTQGVATGAEPESVYAVMDGTRTTGGPAFEGCCFDYGNAETKSTVGPNGSMDALNFGTECWWITGCPTFGPWVAADLENGMFLSDKGADSSQPGLRYPFVTALLSNDGLTSFALKGANAQTGNLTTFYNGPLPPGYAPMKKEGAIILGSGGDNSTINSGGAFFEGAMTLGVPPESAQQAVQADIVAAGYTSQSTLPIGAR